jgi:hypothetical protein
MARSLRHSALSRGHDGWQSRTRTPEQIAASQAALQRTLDAIDRMYVKPKTEAKMPEVETCDICAAMIAPEAPRYARAHQTWCGCSLPEQEDDRGQEDTRN